MVDSNKTPGGASASQRTAAEQEAIRREEAYGASLAFLDEDKQDNKNFWLGMVIAVVFHAALLFAWFPKADAGQEVEREKPKV